MNFVEMTVSCISYNEGLFSIIMHLILNENMLLTSIYKPITSYVLYVCSYYKNFIEHTLYLY